MSNQQAQKEATEVAARNVKGLSKKVFRIVTDLDKLVFTGKSDSLAGMGKVPMGNVATQKKFLDEDVADYVAKQLKDNKGPMADIDLDTHGVLRKKNGVIEYEDESGNYVPATKKIASVSTDGKDVQSVDVQSDDTFDSDAFNAFQKGGGQYGFVKLTGKGGKVAKASEASSEAVKSGALKTVEQNRTILPSWAESYLSDPNAGATRGFLGKLLGARKWGGIKEEDLMKPDVSGPLMRTWNTGGASILTTLGANHAIGWASKNEETNPEGKGFIGKMIDARNETGADVQKKQAEKSAAAQRKKSDIESIQSIDPSTQLDEDMLARSFNSGNKDYNVSVLSKAIYQNLKTTDEGKSYSMSKEDLKDADSFVRRMRNNYQDATAAAKANAESKGETFKASEYPSMDELLKRVREGSTKTTKGSALVIPPRAFKTIVKDEKGAEIPTYGVKVMVGGKEKRVYPIIVSNAETASTDKSALGSTVKIRPSFKFLFVDSDRNAKDEESGSRKFYSADEVTHL